MKKKILRIALMILSCALYSCTDEDFRYERDYNNDGTHRHDHKRYVMLQISEETDSTLSLSANGCQFSLIKVEGGTFMMGAQSSDSTGANFDPQANNEGPVHEVTLSSYMIGETEVTEGLWAAVMDESETKGNKPKADVSYGDAINFIKKLNSAVIIDSTGKELHASIKFSLPSEAQWEYAARGGAKSKGTYFAGSNSAIDVACCSEYGGSMQDVAQREPNELGLYDMSGNLKEWCTDRCDSVSSYTNMPKLDPQCPFGRFFVVRSGSFSDEAAKCRVSSRFYSVSSCYDNIGFRLAIRKDDYKK